MPIYNAQAFAEAVLAEFPSLREGFAAAGGALNVQVGDFALFTQAAKARGDWPTYERCIRTADRLFADADAALGVAFRTSYFEHLDFEGTRGPAAWQLLTPRLQVAWKQMDAENRRLMALPQKHHKETKAATSRPGRTGRKSRRPRRR